MNPVYDCHIHMMPGRCDAPETFLAKITAAGMVGGSIFSLPPKNTLFYKTGTTAPEYRERIANVLDFCRKLPDTFHPFFWLNPTEPDALEQIRYAKEHGILGFKVLCSNYAPSEGLAAYRECARLGLPVHFHSGILYDGEVSGGFNRPLEFECLLEVSGLRFALAHISWPWIDECLALFGKFRSAADMRSGPASEMYIDTCPGAPEFDRVDAFRKMGLLPYDAGNRLLFGIDSSVNNYCADRARRIYEFDRNAFDKFHTMYSDPVRVHEEVPFTRHGLDALDFNGIFENAVSVNYLRFIGKEDGRKQ